MRALVLDLTRTDACEVQVTTSPLLQARLGLSLVPLDQRRRLA